MKVAPPVRGGAGDDSGGAAKDILAAVSPCPYAAECRHQWLLTGAPDSAECGHCYQTLTRTDLARILEGGT